MMDMTSHKTWALIGGAGGAGFGLGIAPLIYILVNLFIDGVTFGETVSFAIGNGFTWGVFGALAGVFAWFVNAAMER